MTPWLTADRLFAATDAPPLPHPFVRVEQGIIRDIRSRDNPPPAGEPIEHFPGCTLLPGLIDAHIHLSFCADGRPMQRILDDPLERLYLRTLANAQAALMAGVTTVRDCGGRDFVVLAVRNAINDGLVPGPRILSCAMPITTTRGHLWYCGAEADSTHELIKKVREFSKRGIDFTKICVTGGFNTPGSNRDAAQYPLESVQAVVADSHRLNLKVASHALSREGIFVSVRAGVDTVEHCTWFTKDGFDYHPETVQEMKEKGIYAGFNFSGNFRAAMDAEGNLDFSAIPDVTGDLRRKMRREELPFFLTTDAGIPLMRHEDFALSVEVGARFMELSPAEAVIAATREPARAIGLSDVGTLEIGKRADFLVVEGNPLEQLADLRKVRAVYRDGSRVVSVQDGRRWLCEPF